MDTVPRELPRENDVFGGGMVAIISVSRDGPVRPQPPRLLADMLKRFSAPGHAPTDEPPTKGVDAVKCMDDAAGDGVAGVIVGV